MKRTLILGTASVLAATGVIIALTRPKSATAGAAAAGREGRAAVTKTATAEDAAATGGNRGRDLSTAGRADLVEKYGESRTRLAGRVGNEFLGLLEDGLQMLELVGNDVGKALGGASMSMNGTDELGKKLKLDAEQLEKLGRMQADLTKRQAAQMRTAIDTMRRNSDKVSEFLLASDAAHRGELPDEDYRAAQSVLVAEFEGLPEILQMEESNPFKDETFHRELTAVLHPEQQELLVQLQEEEGVGNEAKDSYIPPMDLEEMETNLTATRKILGGTMQLMKNFETAAGALGK